MRSKTARAASAGPTKFAALKTAMYQGTRVRIHSGMNAAAITAAARSGGRISAAVSIGASESAEPWCFSRSRESWWTNAIERQQDRERDPVGARRVESAASSATTVATVAQTTANSNAAAGALRPGDRCRAADSILDRCTGASPARTSLERVILPFRGRQSLDEGRPASARGFLDPAGHEAALWATSGSPRTAEPSSFACRITASRSAASRARRDEQRRAHLRSPTRPAPRAMSPAGGSTPGWPLQRPGARGQLASAAASRSARLGLFGEARLLGRGRRVEAALRRMEEIAGPHLRPRRGRGLVPGLAPRAAAAACSARRASTLALGLGPCGRGGGPLRRKPRQPQRRAPSPRRRSAPPRGRSSSSAASAAPSLRVGPLQLSEERERPLVGHHAEDGVTR